MQIQRESSPSKQDMILTGDKVESPEEMFHWVLEANGGLVESINIMENTGTMPCSS